MPLLGAPTASAYHDVSAYHTVLSNVFKLLFYPLNCLLLKSEDQVLIIPGSPQLAQWHSIGAKSTLIGI